MLYWMAALHFGTARIAGVRPRASFLATIAVATLASAAVAFQGHIGGAHVPAHGPVVTHARTMQLAGNPLSQFPWFEYVEAFFTTLPVTAGIDPVLVPALVGANVDLWVVAHRSPAEWDADPVLVDVRGAPQTETISAGSIAANTFPLSSSLSGDAGLGLGVGYDLVVDVNQNGRMDADDLIDGYTDDAGFYVCSPTGVPGPLAVTEVIYNGGTWLGQDIYYPTAIASMGALPLVVVSHGNGHQYTWYDHIGNHLASWGYVVMSHQNNTMPGIETASTTTLTNTDHFLGNLATIAGGALLGHVDSHNIVWIGHSRGGEGVCRAYDRIFDGTYTPTQYTLGDIKLVSSIAPTDFLGVASANPHGVPYHLWVGGADADVSGCSSGDIVCSYPLLKRATGFQQSIELHGAGHGAFHDGGGSTVSAGPCLLSRADVHTIMKAYLLPLVKRYVDGNVPAKEFLWRQWERFQSPGVATNSCVVVDLQYLAAPEVGDRVIDDFQTIPATDTSSSGGAVTSDVSTYSEGRLDDANTSFTFGAAEPFNGMTENTAADGSKGIVFQWSAADRFVDFEVVPALQDESSYTYLAFRATQCTRAPETAAVLDDLDFTVVLRDVNANESSIRISAYGGGIEEPYQRTSCGTGTGWNNEWETIRIRLTDFARDGAPVDLTQIAGIQFRFGPSHGAASGRIGMDDIAFTRD